MIKKLPLKTGKWEADEIELLHRYYSKMGKEWCASALCRSSASIRAKTSDLGLKIDHASEFCKEYQKRAAKSKIGKKRPNQALVMKRLHEEGKLKKTQAQKAKTAINLNNWFKSNPHPKGMLGKKHTAEVKKIIGIKSKALYENMSEERKNERVMKILKTKVANGQTPPERKRTTWKGGWREIGGYKKYYRSRWEANYARFLQWLKETGKIKDWKHEPKTFWFEGIKRGCVSYLPDFWVEELDETVSFHEVKGWMDDRSKTKIKRMAKYYPEVTLIVIAAKEYKAIEDDFSKNIKEWEAKS
jgi:hypothetical protein